MPPKKKAVLSTWTDVEIFQLISSIEEIPVLYDSDHVDYKNDKDKAKYYDQIATTLKKEVNDVKNKWRVVRDYYLKEKRKEAAAIHSGMGADELYESKWKFFHSMHFLNSCITVDEAHSNLKGGSQYCEVESGSETESSIVTPPAKRAKKVSTYVNNKSEELMAAFMQKSANCMDKLVEKKTEAPIPQQKDHITIFSEFVADQLRTLAATNPNLSKMAEFEIQRVILDTNMKASYEKQYPATNPCTSYFAAPIHTGTQQFGNILPGTTINPENSPISQSSTYSYTNSPYPSGSPYSTVSQSSDIQ